MKLLARRLSGSHSRRRFLARTVGAAGALALSGCDALSRSEWFPKLLAAGESPNRGAQHLLTSRKAMAQEFTDADLSPEFRRKIGIRELLGHRLTRGEQVLRAAVWALSRRQQLRKPLAARQRIAARKGERAGSADGPREKATAGMRA